MDHGKTPNKGERYWMAAIADLGCIVCLNQGRGYVPAAVHHMLSGGLRMGHMFTIPLCHPGHHQGAPKGSGEISRHPDKARFEERYGTEMELLEQVKSLITLKQAMSCRTQIIAQMVGGEIETYGKLSVKDVA